MEPATNPKPSKLSRWKYRILITLVSILLGPGVGIGSFNLAKTVLRPLNEDRKVSIEIPAYIVQASLIGYAVMFLTPISGFFIGWILDRFSRRRYQPQSSQEKTASPAE